MAIESIRGRTVELDQAGMIICSPAGKATILTCNPI